MTVLALPRIRARRRTWKPKPPWWWAYLVLLIFVTANLAYDITRLLAGHMEYLGYVWANGCWFVLWWEPVRHMRLRADGLRICAYGWGGLGAAIALKAVGTG